LKSIAAQAVATAGLNNPIPAPTDYSAENRGKYIRQPTVSKDATVVDSLVT